MSPMNPRLMRPIASRATLPPYAPVAYTRLWAVTTQSSGDIEGEAESDTGYYAVKWWDNSVDVYDSGDPFSKAAAGNPRVFEVYPSDVSGDPSGDFEGFDVSGNDLTKLRADNVTLASSGGAQTGGQQALWGPGWWWGPFFSPTIAQNGKLENNLLNTASLDQFYTDLDSGTGSLFVAGNPGIDADDPTIATAKGYTVFGSVPPGTSLLLNFNGSNGSTTFTDSSPNGLTVTAINDGEISTAESKFGGSSLDITAGGVSVAAPVDPVFNNAGDFTIEAWLYLNAAASGMNGRFLQRGDYPLAGGWAISRNGFSSPIELNFETYNPATLLMTSPSIPDDTWTHFALTRQGDTFRMFVDGQLVSTETITPTLLDGSLQIGCTTSGGQNLSGYVDDLRIVNVTALYTATFTPPAAQLGVYP